MAANFGALPLVAIVAMCGVTPQHFRIALMVPLIAR